MKLELELTAKEIQILSRLMFKGLAYDDAYYPEKEYNRDNKLYDKVLEQICSTGKFQVGLNGELKTVSK